ncbi:unnamed protein product, partial [Durusdinium trenchii]
MANIPFQDQTSPLITAPPRFVLLADPNVVGNILIGCTDNFEQISGWSRQEVLGMPCDFLLEGCGNLVSQIQALKSSMLQADEFIGVLMARRKSGLLFSNLTHMFSIIVGGRRYLLLIQADVSDIAIDLSQPMQVLAVRQIAVSILRSDIDAWVLQQYASFYQSPTPQPQLPQMQQAYAQEIRGDGIASKMELDRSLLTPQQPCLKELAPDPAEIPQIPLVASPGRNSLRWADWQEQVPMPEFYDTPTSLGQQDTDLIIPEYPEALPVGRQLEASTEPCPSLGSVNHPHGCTECQFHFFSRAGCRMGADCRF